MWRAVIGGGLVVILLIALLPLLVAPIVRDRICDAIRERTGLDATIDSLSLSWSGEVRMEGLRVDDAGGERVAELPFLAAHVSLLNKEFTLEARDAEVVLREREGGSWNFHEWLNASEDASDRHDDDSTPEKGALPEDVYAEVFCNGRIRIEAQNGTTVLDMSAIGHLMRAGEYTHPSGKDGIYITGSCDVITSVADTHEIKFSLHRQRIGVDVVSLDFIELPLEVLDLLLASAAPGRSYGGALSGPVELSVDSDKLSLVADLGISNLEVGLPGNEEREALVLRDPKVTLKFDAEVDIEKLDVRYAEFRVASSLVNGIIEARATGLRAWTQPEVEAPAIFESLQAHLTYRPTPLGELLAPWLPVSVSNRMSGEEEERIDLDFSGSMAAPNLEALLAGLDGSATIGLGRIATEMIDVEGDLRVDLGPAASTWEAKLDANGGKLTLSGDFDRSTLLDPEAKPRTTLVLHATELEATSRLSPLLSIIHPAFAAMEAIESSSVAGVIECDVDLAYTGPLTKEAIGSGWDVFPTAGIQGTGRFALTGARLHGAPALQEMLSYLGVDPSAEMHIRPIEFTILDGRLSYDGDWTWTIGGVETTFSGSVGLDRTLDLAWNVPVTPEAVERNSFLSVLEGRTIRLPIGGTASDPKLEWRAALRELAGAAALGGVLEDAGLGEIDLTDTDSIKEALGDLVERAITGRSDTSDSPDSDEVDTNDPAVLLAEADRLWDAGQKLEAAELYRRIRKDHKISIVYALNRSHIKRRGKYEE